MKVLLFGARPICAAAVLFFLGLGLPPCSSQCVGLPAGALGWWAGDNKGGDLVQLNHALLVGGVAATNGVVGGALSFNGSSAYAIIHDTVSLRPPQLTVECWVRFDSLDSPAVGLSPAGQQYLVFRQNTRTATFDAFALTKSRVSGRDYFAFEVSSAAGQNVLVRSVTSVAVGVWYHVAGVREAESISVFVNGRKEAEAAVSFPLDYGVHPIYLGTTGLTTWDHKLRGALDEVTIYDRPLATNEIAAIYGAGASGKCKSPVLLSQPQDAAGYWGTNLSLTVSAKGALPLTYNWSREGMHVSSDTNALLALDKAQFEDAGQYAVVVTNDYGSATSETARVTINLGDLRGLLVGHPEKSAALEITGVASQPYAIFGSTSLGDGAWAPVTNLVLGSSTDTWLDPRPLQPALFYRLGPGPVFIPNQSPLIAEQPKDCLVLAGGRAEFSVEAFGGTPLAYQWRFEGRDLVAGPLVEGVDTSRLTILKADFESAGEYSVVVSNPYGAITSAVAVLSISNTVISPTNLVGWWPGDGTAADIAGTNHGILRGGARADEPGVTGSAFWFNGTNTYVEIPNRPELNPAELTVECWVKFNNLDAPGTSTYIGQQYLVYKQNSRVTDFEAYVLSKDRTYADIILWEVTSAAGKLVRIDSISPVVTNVWFHLAGVRGSNYIQLYFNGVLEAQTSVDFPQNYGTLPLYFGTSGQAYWDRKLNGVLDEVALYNRALSSNEIVFLYQAGAAGKTKRPTFVSQPQGGTAPAGSNFTFSADLAGARPATLTWLKEGLPIAGATNRDLTLTGLQPADAGIYSLWATNAYGSATSAPAVLEISAGSPRATVDK